MNVPLEGSCAQQKGMVEGIRRAQIGFMLVKIAGLALVASSYEFASVQKYTLVSRIRHSKPFKVFRVLWKHRM